MPDIKIGETLPQVSFKTLGPKGIETYTTAELFNDKKVLVIGVMGAFTPVCTLKHLPEFVPFAAELKKQGIADKVFCISVVDPFVLSAWAKEVDPESKILMLTDTNAQFTQKLGLDIDLSHLGLGIRSTRYAALIENGTVTMLNVEKAPQNLEVSSRDAVAETLGVKLN